MYGDDSCSARPGSSAGDLMSGCGHGGKFAGKCVNCVVACGQCGLAGDVCVCGGLCCSAHDCGCVAHGSVAMAAK